MAVALGRCLVFRTVVLKQFKIFKMERESFKECSEAALSDEILLRGTSYVFINAGRYFFFIVQNRRSGVLKNIFNQPKEFTVKKIYVDINL